MSLAAGTRFGPYEILTPLGAGGMGEVYRARDTRLSRDVAVKVLPASFASDPDRRARFEREAQAVAALSHPNIVAIHDTGLHPSQELQGHSEQPLLYVVMELLAGQTLLTNGETTTLYRVFLDIKTWRWRKLGPVYPPIRAITGFDGRLFGVRDGGPPRVKGSNSDDELDLYSREGTNYDLTWTKIGTVPARTYAIAAYYGRLYALQAEVPEDPVTTTLYWRAAVADVDFNARLPSLLFLHGATIAVGSLSGGGCFLQTGAGSLDFSYTHATRANDGLVFFYNRPTQSGVIVRFAPDATYEKVQEFATSAFDQWDLMAYVRCGYRDWSDYSDVSGMQEKIIFYRNNGKVAVGSFHPDTGDYTEEWTGSGQATSLSHIVCTWAGDLLLYKSSNGAVAWGRVGNDGEYHQTNSGTMASGQDQVVAAGNTYLLFYDDSDAGPAALNPLHTTLTNVSSFNIGTGRKLTSCENGLVFDYNPGAGGGKIYGLTADASASTATYEDDVSNHGIVLRAYGTEGFGAGWSTIIGIGVLE